MTILLGKFTDYKKGIGYIEHLITSLSLENCTFISLGGLFLLSDTQDEMNFDRDISYLQDILHVNNCILHCLEEPGSDPAVFKENKYKSPTDNIHVQAGLWYHKDSETAFVTISEPNPFVLELDSADYDQFINSYYAFLDHLLDNSDVCPVKNVITNTIDDEFIAEINPDVAHFSFIDYKLDPLRSTFCEFFKSSSVSKIYIPSNRDVLQQNFKNRVYKTIMPYQTNLLCLIN